MFVTGRSGAASSDHAVYVAGRYRDGALSDTWTDVTRCAPGTFVAYVPTCSCGWTGAIRSNTLDGFRECQRALRSEHLSRLQNVPTAAVRGQVGRRGPHSSLALG
jgi:CubicO group peptidase (beta-lactamase class C family)